MEDGIRILDALSGMPCTTNNSPLLDQYGFMTSFSECLSSHPWGELVLICLLTGSSSCASFICNSLVSEAGSDENTLSMCAYISSSSIEDWAVLFLAWNLESASAMYIFFPETCLISWKWNPISRILNHWVLGGSWSSVCVLRGGTRSLWSVSTEIDVLPSFSIRVYLVSVGVIALDMKETGWQELSELKNYSA